MKVKNALRGATLLAATAMTGGCSSTPHLTDSSEKPRGVEGGEPVQGDANSAASDGQPEAATGDGFAAEAEGGASDADARPEVVDAADDGAVYQGPPRPAPLCGSVWGPGIGLDVSTLLDDSFNAITPNERTMAWSVGIGPTATIDYADRVDSAGPFGAPQTLAASSFAADPIALSPDGLRLVVVNQDRQGFSEWTRPVLNSAFASPTAGAYSNLNAPGVLSAGRSYGDPVLSPDDRSFYYSVYGGGQTATIFRTSRLFSGDAWPAGYAVQAAPELAALGAQRRRPTAISADQQTLFFWDESAGTARAAWLNDSTGIFDMFVTLDGRGPSAPNADCGRLYYSAPGASSVDLFAATR